MIKNEYKKVKSIASNVKGLATLLLYGSILGYCLFTVVAHKIKLDSSVKNGQSLESVKTVKKFRHFYFTGWNFALQITFLILAVTDEISKFVRFKAIQRPIEKVRLFLFSTLVFPSSLLVTSIFWVIWHIDRELIFPKILDDFYPSWLNHTLHTFIIVPLIVEMLVQFKNKNYSISRLSSAITLLTYCTIYQLLYLSIYFTHGIWLYPIYNVLTWIQRVGFIVLQLFLIMTYQQIGISLMRRKEKQKTKEL